MIENIVPEVREFIRECAQKIADLEHDWFDYNTCNECSDQGIDSPIEQLFYAAFKALQKMNEIPESDPIETKEGHIINGIGIHPQYKINKYRVDFLVFYQTPIIKRQAVVECDSQQFHERTEKERRYEKQRDRHLQDAGLRTFHFTGSEIKEDPFKVAAEVIAYLKDKSAEDIESPAVI